MISPGYDLSPATLLGKIIGMQSRSENLQQESQYEGCIYTFSTLVKTKCKKPQLLLTSNDEKRYFRAQTKLYYLLSLLLRGFLCPLWGVHLNSSNTDCCQQLCSVLQKQVRRGYNFEDIRVQQSKAIKGLEHIPVQDNSYSWWLMNHFWFYFLSEKYQPMVLNTYRVFRKIAYSVIGTQEPFVFGDFSTLSPIDVRGHFYTKYHLIAQS